MKFEERLLYARKIRGMSQEVLAEKIGVSRQAVSKWETGDAQPDYTKLIALADALEVSLDYLCAREETLVNNPEVPVQAELPKKRKVWPWLVGVLAALILMGIGLFAGWQIVESEQGTVEPVAAQLPDEFYVKDVSFNYVEGEGLHYQFTPSVAGRGYTYYLEFGYSDGPVGYIQVGKAEYKNGVCSGVIELEPRTYGYNAYFCVSNGFEALRAEGRLRINHDGSYPG